MTLFTNNDVSSGNIVRASDHNSQGAAIKAVVNGNIDNSNINASAAIAGTKLADSAITTAKIADAAVTNAKLSTSTGEAGAFTSFTPSWTNLTVGNGTLGYANYTVIGKEVIGELKFTLGSTSSVGTDPYITPPVTPHSQYTAAPSLRAGTVTCVDTGTALIKGHVQITPSSLILKRLAVSGSNVVDSQITSSAPFTWTTGDIIMVEFRYRKD